MIVKGTFYFLDTGEIEGIRAFKIGDALANCPSGCGWVYGEADQFTEYFVDGQPVTRPQMIATKSKSEILADGADVSVISGVPAGAEITDNGLTMTADGSDIEFVTDIPGEHRLQITLWPYQDAEVIIHAI